MGLEKFTPKFIYSIFNAITSEFSQTTPAGVGYNGLDLTPNTLRQIEMDKSNRLKAQELIKEQNTLIMIKLHKY